MLSSVDAPCPDSSGSFLTRRQNNGSIKETPLVFHYMYRMCARNNDTSQGFVATCYIPCSSLFFVFSPSVWILKMQQTMGMLCNLASHSCIRLQVEVDALVYVLALSLPSFLFPISGALFHAVHWDTEITITPYFSLQRAQSDTGLALSQSSGTHWGCSSGVFVSESGVYGSVCFLLSIVVHFTKGWKFGSLYFAGDYRD